MAKSRDEAKNILKQIKTANLYYIDYSTIDNSSDPSITTLLDIIEMALLRKYEEGKMVADLQLQAMKVLYGDKK